jgi:8-oxo-dGTP pyrophosphatase MutT (NUDIX family)
MPEIVILKDLNNNTTFSSYKNIYILLQRRSESSKNYPLHWTFPGGHSTKGEKRAINGQDIDVKEAGLRRCVIRELVEEGFYLSIDISNIFFLIFISILKLVILVIILIVI